VDTGFGDVTIEYVGDVPSDLTSAAPGPSMPSLASASVDLYRPQPEREPSKLGFARRFDGVSAADVRASPRKKAATTAKTVL
jgi:hypothetical protein